MRSVIDVLANPASLLAALTVTAATRLWFAGTKAEMKKVIIELQALTGEFNSALDRTSAKIEANDNIGSGLRDLYERISARSQEMLDQLDRLQNSLHNWNFRI